MEQFQKYLISVDKNLNVVSAERSFLEYLGKSEVGNLDQIIPPQDLMQLRNAVFAIDTGALGLSCFRILTANGGLNWIAANVEKAKGRDDLIHMELSDIQTLKSEGALAHYDEMTGLLNKQAITDYAIGLTQKYPRHSFYFCLMDIDHFKNVNDSFGHMVGDEVIIDVAHIIRDCVGLDGKVGRIGGDEFMLVLDRIDRKPRVREVLSDIRETVETKYRQFRDCMDITVSIGCALFPDYAGDYGELFMLTDKMLYLAKVKGRNRYIIYTPEVHGDVHADVQVTATTHRINREDDKLHLMLGFMDRFLHRTDISIQMAIEQMLAAYDLDEVYIFTDGVERSRYGIRRVEAEGDDYGIENVENAMPILETQMLQSLFDKNNLATVNIYNLNKELQKELYQYMERNERRFMVVYHMREAKKEGYLVFINKRDSSCRLSESDISDLAYFGRMVELTSMDR